MPIKQVPYFDIHDTDVTPVIYFLLFAYFRGSDNFTNDGVHWMHPAEELLDVLDLIEAEHENSYIEETVAYFNDRIAKPGGSCYGNPEQLAALIARPVKPTFADAVQEFRVWLEAQGHDWTQGILIKVWW